MLLRRLDLIRYGIFSDRSIELRADAAIHIIVGPNESGKSTALAAVTDLLYGIESRTTYAFRHDMTSLRIGAKIESANGARSLEFGRRKGNRGTLLDTAGSPLPDDCLHSFIGAVSRDVFTHAFGLNREKLKAGAKEMLQNDGDTGSSIFVAASGLKALSAAQAHVRDVADKILGSRKSKTRIFDQHLERHEEAKRRLRDVELTVGKWAASHDALKALEEKYGSLSKELDENRRSSSRLERLKRLRPIMQSIEAASLSLMELTLRRAEGGEVPVADLMALEERLEGALGVLEAANSETERTKAELDLESAALGRISVDETLVGKSEAIQRLFGRTGSYDDQQRDLPRIEAERDNKLALVARLAQGIGIAMDLRDEASDPIITTEMRWPDVAAIETVRVLADEGRTLRQELESLARDTSAEEFDLAAVDAAGDRDVGDQSDPRDLRQRFVAFSPILGKVGRYDDLGSEIAAEEAKIAESARRLRPSVADISILAGLPKSAAIEGARKNLTEIETTLARENGRLEDTIKARSEIEKRLKEMEAGRPVPSLEAIQKARHRRNFSWGRLRDKLEGVTEEPAGAALAEAIRNFDQDRKDADDLADEAIRDATKVGRHAQETERLNEKIRAVLECEKAVAATGEDKRQADDAWVSLWKESQLTPLAPQEMSTWVSSIEGLIQRREALLDKKTERDGLEKSLRAAIPALEKLCTDMNVTGVQGVGVEVIARRLEDRLDQLEEDWQAKREADSARQEKSLRIGRLRADKELAEARRVAWSKRWAEAIVPLGLKPDALIEAAIAAIGVWEKLPAEIEAHRSLKRRVDGMNRDRSAFEDEVRALVVEIAPELARVEPRLAMDGLNRRLGEAKSAMDRRDDALKRQERIARDHELAEAARLKGEANLSEVMKLLPAEAEPAALLSKLKRYNKVSAELAADRRRFIEQADGHKEEDIRTELLEYNADGVAARLAALATEEQQHRKESEDIYAQIQIEKRDQEEREASVEAEQANQLKRGAEAALAEAARAWIGLKLEELLLGTIIERKRASQNSPLLQRAGEFFRTITGGAFSGLVQELDDNDVSVIKGHRPDNTLVPLDGMTSGTIDQLYLALRLAYLEDFAGRQESPPFIGDDLFESSDENRTRNGLVALADLGIQTILFTHHKHVAEIATAQLGDRVDVIHL